MNISSFSPLTVSKRWRHTTIAILLVSLTACDGGPESTSSEDSREEATATEAVALPPYTIVESDVDSKDARYRIQVGDTLPNEQESIAIARKVAGIENKPTRNTGVYFTRAGYTALADAQARVIFLVSEEKPEYALQSETNARLKEIESFTFDSIPDKKLIIECIESAGTKMFIYQKPSGEYFKVLVFSPGSYDIEPMKAEGNPQVFTKTEEGEKFTYKLNESGTSMDVYNGNNTLFNSFKVIRKG
ncbi:MAG TPA: hypothetical protein VF008_29545 [Niastella sp.]